MRRILMLCALAIGLSALLPVEGQAGLFRFKRTAEEAASVARAKEEKKAKRQKASKRAKASKSAKAKKASTAKRAERAAKAR
jgi:hypothetical protein